MSDNRKFKAGDFLKIKNQEELNSMVSRGVYTFTLNKRYEAIEVHNDGDPVIVSDNGKKQWWSQKRFVLANDENKDEESDEKMNNKEMTGNNDWKVGDCVKIKSEEECRIINTFGLDFTFGKRYSIIKDNGKTITIESDCGSTITLHKERFVLANDKKCNKTRDLSDIIELLEFLNISQKAQDKLLGMIDEKINQEQQEWQDKIEQAREQARREVKNQLLLTLTD